MRKRIAYGRGIVPEVHLDPIHFRDKVDMSSRYWGCERKRKYKTERTALADLRRIKKTGKLVENAHAYRCQYCSTWHLGHKLKDTL